MININKNIEPTCAPPDPPSPMNIINGLSKEELFKRANSNKIIHLKEALETYADTKNWKRIYNSDNCSWVWNGPTICPCDLAIIALEDEENKIK